MNNTHQTNYPQVLKVEDIQKILKIGRRQAYELVHSNTFRTIRIGKSIRIPTKSFFDWINEQSA
ncbi:helix-turn-helix domain-containing protein [Piscibacillus salipiscarius]|uniref:Helix-turn-helix domain-containing protein n=1 Tax=Piscibacillus salipiscarius TaxID=299480 RepID=A0ABW5Q879_9BACI|nr:helix-turn-helix domain-containing protein [Piscibacillus salipiscarius]